MSMFVRLSVCEHISETTCNLHPKSLCMIPMAWLGPSMAALRYAMYFRFYGSRHSCSSRAMSILRQQVTSLCRRAQANAPAGLYWLWRRRAPRQDESTLQGVSGAESAMPSGTGWLIVFRTERAHRVSGRNRWEDDLCLQYAAVRALTLNPSLHAGWRNHYDAAGALSLVAGR